MLPYSQSKIREAMVAMDSDRKPGNVAPKSRSSSAADVKPSKPAHGTKAQPELQDIRTMSRRERDMLTADERRVAIFKGESDKLGDLSHALFIATSTKAAELLNQSDEVHLPDDIVKASVAEVFREMSRIAHSKKPSSSVDPISRMASRNDPYKDFCICGATKLLGLDMYTNHLFNFYWAKWFDDVPTYREIDAVLMVPPSQDHKSSLFNRIAKDLAMLLGEDMLPDVDEFDEFLSTRPRLARAIVKINKYHTARVERQQKAEEAHLRREAFEKERLEREKASRTQEQAMFAEKKKRELELEKSVQEKAKVAGKKFTPEEVIYWMKTRGRRPPTAH